MIHIVHDRPSNKLKVWVHGILRYTFAASGDAIGNYRNGERHVQYGHFGSIAPGHYKLTGLQRFNPPIASEGPGQVDVADLVFAEDYWRLAKVRAVKVVDGEWSIGGIVAPIGGLARFGRDGIMLHGGGSACPNPFAPEQPLARTEGCTRCHNYDLALLLNLLEPVFRARYEYVIFSVVGDSPALRF